MAPQRHDEATCRGEIHWGADTRLSFASLEDLVAILDRLDQTFSEKEPTLVEVIRETGDRMLIGLGGGAQSLLAYKSASGSPPYYHSLGGYRGNELVTYRAYGERTEFERRALIPMTLARSAIREFVLTGRRSVVVEWEED